MTLQVELEDLNRKDTVVQASILTRQWLKVFDLFRKDVKNGWYHCYEKAMECKIGASETCVYNMV